VPEENPETKDGSKCKQQYHIFPFIHSRNSISVELFSLGPLMQARPP
jgi:hypothetical protein